MAQFNPPLTIAEVQAAFPDSYVRVNPVFAGGQGTVFRVESAGGSVSALKIYVPEPGAELEERTTREVDALRRIIRTTIVRLDDHGTAQVRGSRCRFVSTTLIEGVTLAAQLTPPGTSLSMDAVARVGHDIADAIDALWAVPNRIVHRDIKPQNVMLANSGFAVLIDLGVARHTLLDTLTATGATWGTQGYMSPEQARGEFSRGGNIDDVRCVSTWIRSLSKRKSRFAIPANSTVSPNGRPAFIEGGGAPAVNLRLARKRGGYAGAQRGAHIVRPCKGLIRGTCRANSSLLKRHRREVRTASESTTRADKNCGAMMGRGVQCGGQPIRRFLHEASKLPDISSRPGP